MEDEMQNEIAARVLKLGDLIRIIGRKTAKLKDRDGDLGKIVRVIPPDEVSDDSMQTQFRYDIDLVLGGKLHAVDRCDLQYTTASDEGMTEDSRSKRKRKPSALIAASNAIDGRPEKQKKPRAPKQTKNNGKKQKKAPTAKTNTAKKRSPVNQKTKGSSKKTKAAPVEEPPPPPVSNALDMYEKHRREFERSIGRLEKADVYHFFLGDVPKEFDECYTTHDPTESNSNHNEQTPEPYDSQSATTTQSAPKLLPLTSDNTSMPIESENDQTSTVNAGICPRETTPQHHSITTTSQSPATERMLSNPDIRRKEDSTKRNTINFPDSPPYNFHIVRKRMEHGRYVLDREKLENEQHFELVAPFVKEINGNASYKIKKRTKIPVLHPKGVNWDLFQKDIIGMCDAAVKRNPEMDSLSPGSLGHTSKKIKDLMAQIYEKTGRRHEVEMWAANDGHRFSLAMDSYNNTEPAMQIKWRREAFPERCYERLKKDAICAGLSELDERIASYELQTTLKDSFIGLSYTYNDTGQSEGWMKSLVQEAGDQSEREKAALAIASDDGVIKAQVAATMGSLLIAVQDKVMTELGVLEQKELISANWLAESNNLPNGLIPENMNDDCSPDIVEQPVWGIDCYTRRNITTCLETVFDSDSVLAFIEKWLLPAINACPEDLAYDIANAARMLEGLPFDESSSLKGEEGTRTSQWRSTLLGKALINKISVSGPPWLRSAANLLRRARESLGHDFFRVHPKGHGSIVLCQKLKPNRLVTFYRGEVYPSWRWGEKMDAISLIQEKNGLKPGLPDFFNMALERPQMDPRGYGLLFVDASRKSGYGSMLSHSCQPSCEVRVAAVNGRLTLAMTTLREMTIGDELTFDYNAVTESLNEYQSAICLCGHGKCRGSFLHFATADCYQQVLNRNSPVAVRLANLIKGSTKMVMSEDDENILVRHGFRTAAFGAVSVNRRKASSMDGKDMSLDSMDMVPVWLRTFVADTLRYIEYERRALPIALICNELFTESPKGKDEVKSSNAEDLPLPIQEDVSENEDEDDEEYDDEAKKPVKGSKPEPTFFFYARSRREHFISVLMDRNDKTNATGIELKGEIQKLAAAEWKLLDTAEKNEWKQKAYLDWERNGGREKAELEKQRRARLTKSGNNPRSRNLLSGKNNSKKEVASVSDKKRGKKDGTTSSDDKSSGKAEKISFQAADGEGVSAMEQRIQQLTQTLSRVGRVLDRHREEKLQAEWADTPPSSSVSEPLRKVVHPPFSVMPAEHVVAWMWNHEEGIVRTLLKFSELEVCVSPELRRILTETHSKYNILEGFGQPWCEDTLERSFPMDATEARSKLNDALLEFRDNILQSMQDSAVEIKHRKAAIRKELSRKKKEEQEKRPQEQNFDGDAFHVRTEVRKVMDDLIRIVEKRHAGAVGAFDDETTESDQIGYEYVTEDNTIKEEKKEERSTEDEGRYDLDPWLQNFNKRFKLQKAADLLLFYARTSTFFSLRPYSSLVSTSIEVYARELGNAVPKSVMDTTSVVDRSTIKSIPNHEEEEEEDEEEAKYAIDDDSCSEFNDVETTGKQPRRPKSKLCEPGDIIANVCVEYQGDYVVSQLLQWYNAGIDQKPGLPDLLGCVMLPSMDGCFTIDNTQVRSSRTDRPTGYESRTRHRIVDWLGNPQQRGNPWPEEIRRAFVEKSKDVPVADASKKWLPLGSPILDFLVTGDDYNIHSILKTLGIAERSTEQFDSLLSRVDDGRPAQAVSNWVQCENPECMKWRKVPWHVDIDMISEKFVCKDNVWNPQSASCDAPEDVWDENTDAQVDADGSAYSSEPSPKTEGANSEVESKNILSLKDFRLGAKFDVLQPGNGTWGVGTVVKLDLAGHSKRVKVHFAQTNIVNDLWIGVESPRLAPLHTKTSSRTNKPLKDKAASKLAAVGKKAVEHATSNPDEGSTPGSSKGEFDDDFNDDPSLSTRQASKMRYLKRRSRNGKRLSSLVHDDFIEDSAEESSSENGVETSQRTKSKKLKGKRKDVISEESSTIVTEESSPDDSIKIQSGAKPKPKSNTWTIPKKKRVPKTAESELLLCKPPPPMTNPQPVISNKGNTSPPEQKPQPQPQPQPKPQLQLQSKPQLQPQSQPQLQPQSQQQLQPRSQPQLPLKLQSKPQHYPHPHPHPQPRPQPRPQPQPEFHIARKMPRMCREVMETIHEGSNDEDDEKELGEISSPSPDASDREYNHDRDRSRCRPPSFERHHYAEPNADRGVLNREYDRYDDGRYARGSYASMQSRSWDDDRRDRNAFSRVGPWEDDKPDRNLSMQNRSWEDDRRDRNMSFQGGPLEDDRRDRNLSMQNKSWEDDRRDRNMSFQGGPLEDDRRDRNLSVQNKSWEDDRRDRNMSFQGGPLEDDRRGRNLSLHGGSWEDDLRDRRAHIPSHTEGWDDGRWHGHRDDDRVGGGRYDTQNQSPFGHDRADNRRYDGYAHGNREYSPFRDEQLNERGRYAGDYEIPHNYDRNYQGEDRYCDERSRHYESRNIFQENSSRRDNHRHDPRRHDEFEHGPRGEYGDTRRDYHRSNFGRLGPGRDSSPGAPLPKGRPYREFDAPGRFGPVPGTSPDSFSSNDHRRFDRTNNR